MSERVTGTLRKIDLDKRTGRLLSAEGRKVEIYFGLREVESVKKCFRSGVACVLTGQWVDGLFFDVWAVR
jgi:hypothetical protein